MNAFLRKERDMSLNGGATHYLILSFTNMLIRPPPKITQLRPMQGTERSFGDLAALDRLANKAIRAFSLKTGKEPTI